MRSIKHSAAVMAVLFLFLCSVASTGCSPGFAAIEAANLAVNGISMIASSSDGPSTTDKYNLDYYKPGENTMGGNFMQVEEGKPYYYVAFNSRGADGGEEEWRQFIDETLQISEYQVAVGPRAKDTYPGFVAQQVEGIIKTNEPFNKKMARSRVNAQ